MNDEKNVLKFYFGEVGAWMPLVIMLSFMIIVVSANKMSLLLFSEGAFLAIVAALILAKDKKQLEQVIKEGAGNDTLAVIVIAFLLAGILSQLLKQSGLISGLIWSVMALHIGSGWLPLITFGITALISAACGTTNGAIAAVTPIMLPTATAMGGNGGLVMGAIMSGAILGHNVAPICDTSIVSAMSQETEVAKVVRTRFPYAFIAAIVAAILFAYVGISYAKQQEIIERIDAGSPLTLIMLLVPVLMIFLMLKGYGLVVTLLLCNLMGIILNLVCGFIKPAMMISETGPLVMGLSEMKDIVMFSILLFVVLNIIERSGIFAGLVKRVIQLCHNPRQAEIAIAGISFIGIFAIGADVPAIAALGSFIRKLAKSFGITNTRSANIMDGIQTAMGGMLPYNPGVMISVSLAVASGSVGDTFSFWNMIPYCYYNITIILLIVISIFVRKEKDEKEPEET